MEKTYIKLGIFYVFIVSLFFQSNIIIAQNTGNVFIVVIDGARYSETFGDSMHQYIPNMWDNLRPQSSIFASFYNDGTTLTNSGHANILSGTWQDIANDGSEHPHKPTLFEYNRKQKDTSISNSYVILGKDKLDILSYSDHLEYGYTYRASVKQSTSQYDDIVTFENLKEVVSVSHPRLVLINMAGVDYAGHSGVWNNYISALRRADSLVYELWNYIQSDPIYQDKTTLFVTNDHGRHLDGVSNGFAGHGDSCEGCQHISLLAIGPDTPGGIIDTISRKQIDIAPTVGHLLNFATPYSEGMIINPIVPTMVTDKTILSNVFTLYQNYPNPFNPTSTIRYDIHKPSFVTLKLFNLLGQEVATLVDEYSDVGTYNFELHVSSTSSGFGLSSGAYFYRLSVIPTGLRGFFPIQGQIQQANIYTCFNRLLLLK